MKMEKQRFDGLCIVLTCSMMVTEGLLVLQGRWKEAIPLHLCSISAIAAALLALFASQSLLDYLWYLGMPGALLALLFPAPASSICQQLLDVSYFTTHGMILLIPIVRMTRGMRPRSGRTIQMMLLLMGIAVLASLANSALLTDFLFLTLPPDGTPLETVFHLGHSLYLLILFLIMLFCCAAMDVLAGRFRMKTMK